MKDKIDTYLEFLRFSVAENGEEPQSVADIDWKDLLAFANKQTIVGVYFHGMNKLAAKGVNRPDKYAVAAWFAHHQYVVEANRQANEDAARLTQYFHREANSRSCVLKGQGNALMYPDPYMRMAGDIDLWVDMDAVPLVRFVKDRKPESEIGYHHIGFSGFTQTVAEVHYFPSFMGNLFYEYRLRRYFERVREEQFRNVVALPDGAGSICVPTDGFNRIFQISHVMHHFFFEGVGLRQLIDYYYLLKKGTTDAEKSEDARLLRRFNMYKFASGMMWLLKEVLGLEECYLLVPPNEKVGRMLLHEVLMAGNFGHHDERYSFRGKSVYAQYFIEVYRNLHFALQFPGETVWGRPVSRWWHMVYKSYLRLKSKS